MKVGIEGVALVAEHHEVLAAATAERQEVFIAAAMEALRSEVGFDDEGLVVGERTKVLESLDDGRQDRAIGQRAVVRRSDRCR